MSVSGLFNIGTTAIQTINQMLQITSQNVANANTPGYTLQQAVLQSVPSGSVTTTGASGNGVQITEIKRVYNSFLNSQLNTENANLSYWTNYQTGISQVENVFNETSTTGISPAITTFFNDWQNLSQSPQDDAQRTTLLQDASYLSSRVSTAATSLETQRGQLLTDSQSLSSQVNTISAQIADLNAKIAGNPGALDLLDQRDTLVSQLNSITKVSSFTDNSGMETVLLGGTPLVQGIKSFNLSVTADTSGSMHFYVAQGNSNIDITSSITGGQLKANLDLRDSQIPSYLNQLNGFAIDLTNSVNYYQNQGYGLDGTPGGNFFQPLTSQAKYTSVDSTYGVFNSPSDIFSQNGGTLTIKLGDNDTSPATVNVSAGASLNQTVADINSQAGSKVTAAAVNMGPANEFTVTGSNNTITTDIGSFTVPQGTYTGASLAAAITAQSALAGAGINATFNSSTGQFTIASAGANNLQPSASHDMGSLIGFNASTSPKIGTGITGTALDDYRISIVSNPNSNLSDVRIGVNTTDASGSGLDLLANSQMLAGGGVSGAGASMSSVSVTDPTSLVSNAQYNIDYTNPFDITASNNTINFTYNGTTYTATLQAGNYSGTAMASEIASAMNSATSNPPGGPAIPAGTFSADYGITSPNKFTITNNDPALAAQINWNSSTVTAEQFGFPPANASSPLSANGGTATSESMANAFVINSTNDTMGFTYNGHNYLANVASGAYTSDGLAAAMQTALNAAVSNDPGGPYAIPANTFAVDFGVTVPGELAIRNTSANAVTNFLTGGGNATGAQFGFSPDNTSISANGTLSASTVVTSPYQSDSSGVFWRVMESTDGSTWTAIGPNTSYDPSNSTTLNESQVNLTSETSGSFGRMIEFQGVKVQIDGAGLSNSTGETFNVQLNPNAASDMAVKISDPGKVAAASDMWTVDSTNNTVVFSVNGQDFTAALPQGSYTNDPGQPDDISAALTTAIQTAYQTATGSALPDNFNVAFNASTKQFQIVKTSGTDSVDLQWSNSGSTAKQLFGFSVDSTLAGVGDTAVSDNPATVLASANQGVPGDNTNATEIANIANGTSILGTTPVDAYMSLVSNVGVQGSTANNYQQYQSNLVSQLTQQQQAVSGVSLDQEASNLVVYEKAYQAAAQLITVANTLLSTLLQMVSGQSGG